MGDRTGEEPPYVDTHTRAVAADPDQVWTALRRYVGSMGVSPGNPLAAVLGTRPASGFEVADEVVGSSVALTGRHRFSHYRLVFEIEPGPAGRGTLLHAKTYAAFPGVAGRAYRAAVIGTGLHRVATRQLLRAIAHRT